MRTISGRRRRRDSKLRHVATKMHANPRICRIHPVNHILRRAVRFPEIRRHLFQETGDSGTARGMATGSGEGSAVQKCHPRCRGNLGRWAVLPPSATTSVSRSSKESENFSVDRRLPNRHDMCTYEQIWVPSRISRGFCKRFAGAISCHAFVADFWSIPPKSAFITASIVACGGRSCVARICCPARITIIADVPMSFVEYLGLLDWTGRQLREDKRGAIPSDLAPILERLSISGEGWMQLMGQFRRMFRRAAGRPHSMQREREQRGGRLMQGVRHSRAVFF